MDATDGERRGTFAPKTSVDMVRSQLLDTLDDADVQISDVLTTPLARENSDPTYYMSMLLQHLHLDPDGGIENIKGNSIEQHSKVKILKKNALQTCLAIWAMMRTLGNPVAVVTFGARALMGYYFQSKWVYEIETSLVVRRVPIPIGACLVLTSTVELVGIAWLLMKALVRCVRAISWSSDGERFHLHPRYQALAGLYWHDVPYMQSWSALTPLAFVHPNLLTKNLHQISLKEDIARTRLAKFLKAQSQDYMTDNEIILRVVELLVSSERSRTNEMERRRMANHLFDAKPSEVLEYLQSSSIMQNTAQLQADNFNPRAISACAFNCTVRLELFLSFLTAAVFFFVGCVAFFVKIVRVVQLLIDEDTHIAIPFVFFLSFLNQVMGIISISRLLRWRLECFVFGGADAYVSSEETFIMHMYLGTLNQAVWQSEELTTFQKICFMFQFDDDDIQQMLIEDRPHEKSRLVTLVRKYMKETHATNRLKDTLVELASSEVRSRRKTYVV